MTGIREEKTQRNKAVVIRVGFSRNGKVYVVIGSGYDGIQNRSIIGKDLTMLIPDG